uniref:Centriolar coiled-coil protein 110 n=1 Tax=Pundamilia nyererei TaxID=303518 RepID=A0A3B4GQ94_9CICH
MGDHLAAGFRRRCHTMDSQLHTYHSGAERIDRSQERLPRFMAGVTLFAPSRRTPAAPLNQSYDVENPSLPLLRPCVTPADESPGPNNGRKTPTVLRHAAEAQARKTGEYENQWRAQALEDMQRRLEKEHALQMSLLLAEQEKEQQRLLLVSTWNLTVTILYRSRSEKKLISFILISHIFSMFFITFSQVLTADQQKAFCRIGAITRGFLTRRLLKTEKVKHLRQTIMDTQEFIRSFQTEALQKRSTYTAQDLALQERVRAQLRAALYDIHDIFFEMPLEDRLALLQQDRELRVERKLRDMEKAKCPKERVALSAATQRSLDRKKK